MPTIRLHTFRICEPNSPFYKRDIYKRIGMALLFVVIAGAASAQQLRPGFDKQEYIETLKINQKAHIALDKWTEPGEVAEPEYYAFVYRSDRVAFDNIWDLWIHKSRPVAVIAVQGSIPTAASFLANLYAAMVPAIGELQLKADFRFPYHLADHPQAAVHVGWLISMGFLSASVEQKIDSCYKSGIKDFILTGHSQGAGITYLLTSHLRWLQAEGRLPADIRFKTYCSAGPKPGNLFYAYDYENAVSGGWGFNVVNTADWVPDVPFSIQTVGDFTPVNPFHGAKSAIKKQKFPRNLALRHIYNRLDKPGRRAQKNYQKYLGKMVSRMVKKQLPEFSVPAYYNSNYYVRTGPTVVLHPDEAYWKVYDNDPDKPDIWRHHLPAGYLLLAERLPATAIDSHGLF